jgi:hemerythrin-like metal-binding protein
MRALKWSTSHAVFVTEIDDGHKEIFEAVANLQTALANYNPAPELREPTDRLIACVVEHFAHEERLMRAARYGSIRWHKQQHDNARKRVGQFVQRIERGDTKAGFALVEYLTGWLRDHTRLADRMLGAALRNRQRSLVKMTFQAGTKPANACAWVDAKGDTFDPLARLH